MHWQHWLTDVSTAFKNRAVHLSLNLTLSNVILYRNNASQRPWPKRIAKKQITYSLLINWWQISPYELDHSEIKEFQKQDLNGNYYHYYFLIVLLNIKIWKQLLSLPLLAFMIQFMIRSFVSSHVTLTYYAWNHIPHNSELKSIHRNVKWTRYACIHIPWLWSPSILMQNGMFNE